MSTWLFVDAYGVLRRAAARVLVAGRPGRRRRSTGAPSAERLGAAEERLAARVGSGRRGQRGACARAGSSAVRRRVPAQRLRRSVLRRRRRRGRGRATSTCRGPIAGFVGHINSRTDLALLEAVADAGISLLLIGPKEPDFEPERFDAAREPAPTSRYLGARPFEPAAVVPEGDRRRARAVRRHRVQPRQLPDEDARVPGRGPPVVATSAAGRALAGHRPGLARRQPRGLRRGRRPGGARHAGDRELVARRRAFAATHSWGERAERFARLLGVAA